MISKTVTGENYHLHSEILATIYTYCADWLMHTLQT